MCLVKAKKRVCVITLIKSTLSLSAVSVGRGGGGVGGIVVKTICSLFSPFHLNFTAFARRVPKNLLHTIRYSEYIERK